MLLAASDVEGLDGKVIVPTLEDFAGALQGVGAA